jgi:TonB family protein
MYFDLEDNHPEFTPVGRAISWREGILLSILLHLGAIVLAIALPKLFPGDIERARARALEWEERMRQATQFVFVAPRVDTPAPKPAPRADESDKDRVARSPERAPKPQNDLPVSHGNSSERTEAEPRQEASGPKAGSSPPAEEPSQQESASALQSPLARVQGPPAGASGTGGLMLGDALRNLNRYIQSSQFDNSQGSGAFGPAIQFDTKGVEFGPWIRRFIAQIKRNWEIPYAAMSMKGHVVITFNVHKDGTITDLMVVAPCSVEGFNNAAFGALAASNPTQPLPLEYPAERAFFTITFYYNETPP